MTHNPHNGYTNYETWLIAATIDNTESLYNFFQDWVKEIRNTTEDPIERKSKTMDLVRKVIENMKPKTNNPIWEPLINSVITDQINFLEIANTLLEEY